MIISYGDLDLSTGLPDANGAYWYATGMEGWDGPGMRQTLSNPTGQDGAVMVESLLDSRTVSIQGVCKAPNEAAFWASYNNLISATNNVNSVRNLTVNEVPAPKFVRCYRAEPPHIQFVGVGAFTFELVLTAPDPLKYGLDLHTMSIAPGAVTSIVHGGTYYTPPTITASGNVRVLHEGTGAVVATREGVSVPSGTTFNHRTKTVTNGNTNYYDRLAKNTLWWRLAPGPNSIRNLGSSTIQVVHRDAGL